MLSASTLVATPNLLINPLVTSTTPYGYTPAQVDAAYGFNSVKFGTVTGIGAGQTIAIVDAYNDPNIRSDLTAFDTQFKLAAPPSFSVVNQTGGSSLPATNSGWDLEIALDVEWAHSIAPGASILLVEATSSSLTDLMTAVNYAKSVSTVSEISMSWGSSEFSGEKSYDSAFTTPSGHIGITFIAASGDEGAPAEWPGVSPNIMAVGGTTLNVTSSGAYSSETAWSGSTGGLSAYESEPTFQNIVQSTGKRANPDIAFDANPNTGVAVYDSVATGGQSGWFEVGGTSLGAPSWAGLIAIANQGRVINKLGTLSNGQATLYALSASSYHDITSGSNGGYSAGAAYDAVTGLGSPVGNLVIQELATGTTGTGNPESSSSGLTGSTGGGGGGRHGGFRGRDVVGTSSTDMTAGFQTLAANSTSVDSLNSATGLTAGGKAPSTAPLWSNSQSMAPRMLAGGPVIATGDDGTTAVSQGVADIGTEENSPDSSPPQSPAAADATYGVGDWSAADRAALDQIVARVRRVELSPSAVDACFAAEDAMERTAAAEARVQAAPKGTPPIESRSAHLIGPSAAALAALGVVLQSRADWTTSRIAAARRWFRPRN